MKLKSLTFFKLFTVALTALILFSTTVKAAEKEKGKTEKKGQQRQRRTRDFSNPPPWIDQLDLTDKKKKEITKIYKKIFTTKKVNEFKKLMEESMNRYRDRSRDKSSRGVGDSFDICNIKRYNHWPIIIYL